jgi:hypothetical protein
MGVRERVGRGVNVGVQVGIGEGFVVAVGTAVGGEVGVAEPVTDGVEKLAEGAVKDAMALQENVHTALTATIVTRLRTAVAISRTEGWFPFAIVQARSSELPQSFCQLLWRVGGDGHVRDAGIVGLEEGE